MIDFVEIISDNITRGNSERIRPPVLRLEIRRTHISIEFGNMELTTRECTYSPNTEYN